MLSHKIFYELSMEEILYYIAVILFLFSKGVGLNEGSACLGYVF